MTFYHKRDDGKGGAVSFDLQRYNAKGDYQDGCIWMGIAKQKGNDNKFDWDNQQRIKLGFQDIMMLLPRLETRTSRAKLYHKFNENTKSIIFNKHMKDGKYHGYYLNINKETAFHFSPEEIYTLCIFLRDAVLKIVRWDWAGQNSKPEKSDELSLSDNDIPTSDLNEKQSLDFEDDLQGDSKDSSADNDGSSEDEGLWE